MAWQVMMEDDDTITLPSDLVAKLGWTPETPLCWSETERGVSLAPASLDANTDRR